VLGISGSLRKLSSNTGLIRAAASIISKERELADSIDFSIADIHDLPLFNQDLEGKTERDYPAPVQRVRQQVREADALLFAVPEYNYSMSGVLKNTIDWVSRPMTGVPMAFDGKPTAIMGAGGYMGAGRAQYHFRQSAVYVNLQVVNKPEIMVRLFEPPQKFDDKGNLIDETAKGLIKSLLVELVACTRKLKK